MVGGPGGGVAFQVVGGDEMLAFLAQPAGQLIPLAQQAFQRDFDHDLAVAGVFDQQAFGDQGIDQAPTSWGKLLVARHTPHRLVAVGIDGGQPRDECRPQLRQLLPAVGGVGGEHLVDGGVHHLAHAAHRLVIGQSEFAGAGVQPGQGQGQQRQGVFGQA